MNQTISISERLLKQINGQRFNIIKNSSYETINSHLLKQANSHMSIYNKPLLDKVIFLVHPFSFEGLYNKNISKQTLNAYCSSINALLNNYDNIDYSLAWLTYPEEYLKNKNFNEKNFTKALNTYFMLGLFQNENDYSEFENKKIIFGGMFADLCVKSLVNTLLYDNFKVELLAEALLFSQDINLVNNSNAAPNSYLIKEHFLYNDNASIVYLDNVLKPKKFNEIAVINQ